MPFCKGCSQELDASAFSRDKHRANGLRYRCKSCSSGEFKQWQRTEGYRKRLDKGKRTRQQTKATDPKRRWADMAIPNARQRAKKAGLECTITKDWLLANLPDVCPLLETPLAYANTKTSGDSPSIDRRDSSAGYTPDNCWVISSLANRVKNNATPEQIATIARNLQRPLAVL